ncbi:ATP-dependent RNA helicase HAS1 [Pelomyxa schiedti]|nr:ATP-dependent RNA helicase HAS1 [Pelomyxa schiedti]
MPRAAFHSKRLTKCHVAAAKKTKSKAKANKNAKKKTRTTALLKTHVAKVNEDDVVVLPHKRAASPVPDNNISTKPTATIISSSDDDDENDENSSSEEAKYENNSTENGDEDEEETATATKIDDTDSDGNESVSEAEESTEAKAPEPKRRRNSDAPAEANNPISVTAGKEYTAFSQLAGVVCAPVLKALKGEFGFEQMTPIQAKTISLGLAGRDIMGKARTGSGKTLAFLIPAVNCLLQSTFTQEMGVGAVVLSPTRELVLQIQQVAQKLLKFCPLTYVSVIGGTSVRGESSALSRGCSLIMGTPGRFYEHLENADFKSDNLKCLVLDEADRLLDIGFLPQLTKIVLRLPKNRHTMMFSATMPEKVGSLGDLFLKNPVFVDVEEKESSATPSTLTQHFMVCPAESKFDYLVSFLCSLPATSKVIVFMALNKEVKFFFHYIAHFVKHLPVSMIAGRMSQSKRTNVFFAFQEASTGVLVSTDVSARGIDIPAVDWIVQFDFPVEADTYIHRVGRTARAGRRGRALILAFPWELPACRALAPRGVVLDELPAPAPAAQPGWLVPASARMAAGGLGPVAAKITVPGQPGGGTKAVEVKVARAWAKWYNKQQRMVKFDKAATPLDKCLWSFGLRDPADLKKALKKPQQRSKTRGRKPKGETQS